MSNAGIAPFYYPLTLNAKGIDTNTESLIALQSLLVPMDNQLDPAVCRFPQKEISEISKFTTAVYTSDINTE